MWPPELQVGVGLGARCTPEVVGAVCGRASFLRSLKGGGVGVSLRGQGGRLLHYQSVNTLSTAAVGRAGLRGFFRGSPCRR